MILTADQVYSICRGLIPIGDVAYEYAEKLQDSGFCAFEPYEEFFRSFAKNVEEYRLHCKINTEMSKTQLGQPWPPLYFKSEYDRVLFSSSLLTELSAKRDAENGVPETELESRYTKGEALWRREIDPCNRNMYYIKVTDRQTYNSRWELATSNMEFQLQQESKNFASELSQIYGFDPHGRWNLFKAVMDREAGSLGFHYDKHKSGLDFPVFSKQLTNEWDLCWAIEDRNMFLFNELEGHFMPSLEVRHRKIRGSIAKAKPGEFLNIRYVIVVPGFFNAYRTFRHNNELETVIRAHLCLYRFMSPMIEVAIMHGLGGRPAPSIIG